MEIMFLVAFFNEGDFLLPWGLWDWLAGVGCVCGTGCVRVPVQYKNRLIKQPKVGSDFRLSPEYRQAGKRGVARRRTGLSAGATAHRALRKTARPLLRGSAGRISCTSRATPRFSPPGKKAIPKVSKGRAESPLVAPAGAIPPRDKQKKITNKKYPPSNPKKGCKGISSLATLSALCSQSPRQISMMIGNTIGLRLIFSKI